MDYPKKQLYELYKIIPKDLQKAVTSKEIADTIYKSSVRHGLKDKEKIRDIIKHTCYVLFGIIPPGEIQETLEKEGKLEKGVAKNISKDINDLVFFPLKDSLESIYKAKIAKPEKVKQTPKPKIKDKYRESIE